MQDYLLTIFNVSLFHFKMSHWIRFKSKKKTTVRGKWHGGIIEGKTFVKFRRQRNSLSQIWFPNFKGTVYFVYLIQYWSKKDSSPRTIFKRPIPVAAGVGLWTLKAAFRLSSSSSSPKSPSLCAESVDDCELVSLQKNKGVHLNLCSYIRSHR